jgi:hypothetical protein
MLSQLSYKAPTMALGPIPDTDPYGRNPLYWESRKRVKIPIKKYFEWLNVNIWTCSLSISHTILESNNDGTNATSTIASYSKVFEVNYRRENKAPGYTYSGDIINPPLKNGEIYQTTDSYFPYGQLEQGPQPVDWWMKQRSNNLIGNNQQRAYFNTTVNWANYKNPIGEGYISFTEYSSLMFGLSVSEIETYYDPDTKMVWPGLTFESESRASRQIYNVNWQGTGLGGDPNATVNLTVDGVAIPAEVYWTNFYNSGGPSISINWTKGSTRDL